MRQEPVLMEVQVEMTPQTAPWVAPMPRCALSISVVIVSPASQATRIFASSIAPRPGSLLHLRIQRRGRDLEHARGLAHVAVDGLNGRGHVVGHHVVEWPDFP